LWYTHLFGKLPDLALVKVADRIESACHVAVQGSVAEQQLGFVAGAEDERTVEGGVVKEDGHPLAGHLVAAAHVVGIREHVEVGIDHRGYRHYRITDSACLCHDQCVSLALRIAGPVRHADRVDILGAKRLCSQKNDQRRVDPAGQPKHPFVDPGFADLFADEIDEYLSQQFRVDQQPAQERPLSDSISCSSRMVSGRFSSRISGEMIRSRRSSPSLMTAVTKSSSRSFARESEVPQGPTASEPPQKLMPSS